MLDADKRRPLPFSQGPSLFDAWYWYLASRGWELAFTPMHATDRPGPIASLEETYDPAMPTSWPDRASPAEGAKQARHQVSLGRPSDDSTRPDQSAEGSNGQGRIVEVDENAGT